MCKTSRTPTSTFVGDRVVILVVLYPPPPLASPASAESLANATGRAAYEARLWLASPLPHIVARVADRASADAQVAALQRAGFDAEWIDDDTLLSSSEMSIARSPAVHDAGLVANAESREFVRWEDMRALVFARSSVAVERTENEMVVVQAPRGSSYVTTRERTRRERAAQNVLYVFSSEAVWLFEENGIRWASLGVPLLPTRRDNFNALVSLVRARAVRASFDDSLVSHPPPQFDLVLARDRADVRASPNRAMDVAAQLIARRALRARGGPFRTPAKVTP
jgi:hypothetical protein